MTDKPTPRTGGKKERMICMQNYMQAVSCLPPHLSQILAKVDDLSKSRCEEICFRVGQPIVLNLIGGCRFVSGMEQQTPRVLECDYHKTCHPIGAQGYGCAAAKVSGLLDSYPCLRIARRLYYAARRTSGRILRQLCEHRRERVSLSNPENSVGSSAHCPPEEASCRSDDCRMQ